MDGTSAGDLTKHLDACVPCYDRCQLEQAFRAALRRQASSHSVPDGLAARLRMALDADGASRRTGPAHGSIPPTPSLPAWADPGVRPDRPAEPVPLARCAARRPPVSLASPGPSGPCGRLASAVTDRSRAAGD